MPGQEREPESLKDEVNTIIQESRMVLPGIQTLFGFQLVAVFNARFSQLVFSMQVIHIVSMLLVAISIALIMTPAAYHRIAERGQVSRYLAELSSGLITIAMLVLLLGITVELYVVVDTVLGNALLSAAVAVGAGLVFASLWFAFPAFHRKKACKPHALRIDQRA